MKRITFLANLVFILLGVLVPACRVSDSAAASKKTIDIFNANPAYWQYDRKPVLLLGGSVEDNLF